MDTELDRRRFAAGGDLPRRHAPGIAARAGCRRARAAIAALGEQEERNRQQAGQLDSVLADSGEMAVVGCPAVRRLLRILVNALTILSLLLLWPVAALWVRSYWRADSLRRDGRRARCGALLRCLYVRRDGAGVTAGVHPAGPAAPMQAGGWTGGRRAGPRSPTPPGGRRTAGASRTRSRRDAEARYHGDHLPLWLPTALFAALPLARRRFIRRRRRSQAKGTARNAATTCARRPTAARSAARRPAGDAPGVRGQSSGSDRVPPSPFRGENRRPVRVLCGVAFGTAGVAWAGDYSFLLDQRMDAMTCGACGKRYAWQRSSASGC